MTTLRKEPSEDIILVEWQPVFTWRYKCQTQICGLTKRHLTDLDDGDEVSIGACGHAFHHSALMKWFETQKKDSTSLLCPTCKMPWKYTSSIG